MRTHERRGYEPGQTRRMAQERSGGIRPGKGERVGELEGAGVREDEKGEGHAHATLQPLCSFGCAN